MQPLCCFLTLVIDMSVAPLHKRINVSENMNIVDVKIAWNRDFLSIFDK